MKKKTREQKERTTPRHTGRSKYALKVARRRKLAHKHNYRDLPYPVLWLLEA